MKISKLLEKIDIIDKKGTAENEIRGIVTDSRKIIPGDCFVCIRGFRTDGHTYANQVAAKGAALIIMDDRAFFTNESFRLSEKINSGAVTLALCENSRYALALLSDCFWGHPSGELNLIGVTGTKGKTTTSLFIKNIYDRAGVKTGLVGTMYNMVGEETLPSERTTPESNELQPLLRRMADEGVKTCVMEDSSQGLKLGRVLGCEYNIGIFTNLSPDHLGPTEHPDMEDYAASKGKLFKMCGKGLVNADSSWLPKVIDGATCELYTYAIDREADFMAKNIVYKSDGVEYDIYGLCPEIHISTAIPGKFSVYNSMAAAGAAFLDGVPAGIIQNGLRDFIVKGKAEIVPTGRDFSVMIDYAHNSDSFINIISAVKNYARRVVFLFGCGGDRNRQRELMGETAATYADFTIITSDNPRSEDPAKIVEDIERGAAKTEKPYICIVDRKEAIWYAIKNAQSGDVIILAGKGHETTQIFRDKVIEFDERLIVKEALESM